MMGFGAQQARPLHRCDDKNVWVTTNQQFGAGARVYPARHKAVDGVLGRSKLHPYDDKNAWVTANQQFGAGARVYPARITKY